jgi:radical SAM superfamily enzyme YgiQ (UPF0313 family)
MLGKEIFTVARPHKTSPSIGISWAYPSTYEVGIAGLGYQLVWWLLEQDLDTEIARVFTDAQEYGWDENELLGFTLSWELDYINVLNLLTKAGVNHLAEQRTDAEPIIFGGGPVLTANPEPFADIFDVILLGDAEAVVPKFLEAWKEVRTIKSRSEKLRRLAAVDGLYVPQFYRYEVTEPRGPLKAIVPTVSGIPDAPSKLVYTPPSDYVAHSVMLSPDSTWANMFLVEVARSCPQECRFCLASYLTRPFRSSNVDTLMSKIDLGLRYTKKIGLLGASVTEHPEFDRIAEELLKRPNVDVSIASVRADSLNPLILEMLSKLGQRSVTIAMESGSERLRQIMKKNLTEEQLFHAIDLIDQSGLQGVKLYGIAGLPGETQEDLDETVRVMTQLKKAHKRLRFVFGCSSFVPKAQTPFQWAGRDRRSAEKLEYLRKRIAKLGIEMRPESHNWSDIQALLSRGDRRLTQTLMEVAQTKANIGSWKKALRNLPPDCPSQDYFVYRDIPYDEVLPWSHLVNTARSGMLLKHSQAAQALTGDRAF